MKLIEALQKRFYGNGSAGLGLLLAATILTVFHPALPSIAQDASTTYQGFGAQTLGGQGKPVYHVTNLNDSGPGSLRDAVSQGNRHVVFDVAGEILLSSPIYPKGAFITIDGFTASPPGITLKNYGLLMLGSNGAHDIIVRGIRVRNSAGDGMQVRKGGYNVVIDHVSIQGSGDGNLDVTEDSHDVTVSWSILAKPAGSEKNMLIKYNPSRITLHHNIFVGALQRNPQVAMGDGGTPATDTTLDMRNNLVWGWRGGYGTLVWYGSWANVVDNFYSNPSSSDNDKKEALTVCKGECDGENPASAARGYVAGNFSNDGFTDYINGQGTEAVPFPAPSLDTTDACTAAHEVLAHAGVKPRDLVDQQYLSSISLPSCGGSVQPTLTVSPNRLDFSATQGGPNPPAKALTVGELNGADLSWGASTGGTWLSLSPNSGATPSTLTVAVNSSDLPAGSHLATISIGASGATNSPVSVLITLTIVSAPDSTTPAITTPTPGSVLPGSSVTLSWSANGTPVKRWRLYVGSSRGARDLHDSGTLDGNKNSKTFSRLPTDGRTVWVQLRFRVGETWRSADFQYTAALK